jgi:hypothetical protein
MVQQEPDDIRGLKMNPLVLLPAKLVPSTIIEDVIIPEGGNVNAIIYSIAYDKLELNHLATSQCHSSVSFSPSTNFNPLLSLQLV